MRHIVFEENTEYSTAILIKPSSLNKTACLTNYIHPLVTKGHSLKDFIAFSAAYDSKGKAPVKLIKEYCNGLLKALDSLGTKTIYVADAAYFKVLSGQRKAEQHLGSVFPCNIKGFEHINIILGINHSSLFHNPNNASKLELSLTTLHNHLNGQSTELGKDVIKYQKYPVGTSSIAQWLENIKKFDTLTCDVETFSLKHYAAGIGTISFAWNEHEGIAFACDYVECEPYELEVWDKKDKKYKKKIAYGKYVINPEVRKLLRAFFDTFKGKLIYHNAAFDVKVLIYCLYMDSLTDNEGLLHGLEVMMRLMDDTKLIAYLATNNCSENSLSLKDLAHEFVGNYAEDVEDIRLVKLEPLLKYNLTDCLATWYVYKKYYCLMVRDMQEDLYQGLFKESLYTIIQMELTGMPMCMIEVCKGKKELVAIHDNHANAINNSPLAKRALRRIRDIWIEQDYLKRKEGSVNPDDIKAREPDGSLNGKAAPANFPQRLNVGSGKQLAVLLHDVCMLPVIETTKTGLPATDDDTLKALLNHTRDESVKSLIEDIRGQLGVDKILSTFIPTFEEAQLGEDGIYYLFGSFNLGGTKSGRLSSSKPNLQNLPSGSTYAKVVKKMFKGNADWLFCGSDFNALEDVVNTLLTKDPNKEAVLTKGFDGHCYRMVHYWPHKFPDLELTPSYVNALKKPYDSLRSDSKPVSFALQYRGTWSTLVKNCGFTKEEAQSIETNYHQLYAVSAEYTQARLKQACQDGYVELAYGLRLRTPMLAKTVLNKRNTPKEAQAEARTAGNAFSGQSYGLINTKAANEFMKRVRNSPYRNKIRIVAQIHDASYYLMRNELGVIKWVNDNLIDCMVNRIEGELPELEHPEIKLGAELDLYPTWAKAITLPNNVSIQDIYITATQQYAA